MSGGSKDSWIISFPKDPTALTRFLCTSSTGKCLVEPQTACTPDSAALTGDEVETMSIVGGTSACSAGSSAASVAGTSLSYGLKVGVNAAHASAGVIYTGEVWLRLTSQARIQAMLAVKCDVGMITERAQRAPNLLKLSLYCPLSMCQCMQAATTLQCYSPQDCWP